jgi:putative transposase
MARPTRLSVHGGTYHVMNRGNRKCVTFEDDHDRRRFLAILWDTREEYDVEILGGSQMGNHFHLVVVTPQANISTFMEQLQGRFAQYSNWRHQRVGHLFQGRFRAVLIENDIHLLTALCYVFMNPVAAGFVNRMEEWKWSTYAATIGLAPVPTYLSIDWLEALFPGTSREQAQSLFRELLEGARPVMAYLEGREFVSPQVVRQVIRSYVGEKLYNGPIPSDYRVILRPSLETIFPPGLKIQDRNAAIYRSHLEYGYTFAEIADRVQLNPESAGRIYRGFRRAISKRHDVGCGG